jgi:hypothetical protein
VHHIEPDHRLGDRPAGSEVEDPAATDGWELVTVADECDPSTGLIGDGEQGAGGVLMQHPRLVDQQQVTASKTVLGGVLRSWVQRPSGSQRQPNSWTSAAADCACVAVLAATWAAFNVGVITTRRWPCRSSCCWVAARVVVFPAPAAPSTTTSRASPARTATAVR